MRGFRSSDDSPSKRIDSCPLIHPVLSSRVSRVGRVSRVSRVRVTAYCYH